jgi:choline dehydrogenase
MASMAHSSASYDYLVVGSGSAGAAAARRLADAAPAASVLLIEAGSAYAPDPLLDDTRQWIANLGGPYDWGYATVPQPGLGGSPLPYPRGRVAGGCSAINGSIWLRGHPATYDGWAASGAEGWDYAALEPSFRAAERSATPRPGRGRDGAIALRPANSITEFAPSAAFLAAAAACGLPLTDDPNLATESSSGWVDLTMHDDGSRASAEGGYLSDPPPNLTRRYDAVVDRVLLDGQRCVGVLVQGPDGPTEVLANVEVIVCAGAIGTPLILQRSGLGGRTDLEQIGVSQVVDLPGVGANLQDHLLGGITYEARQPLPASPTNNGDAIATTNSSFARDEPDLQLLFIHIPFIPPPYEPPANSYTVGVGLLKPFSRGTVRAVSSDPDAPPEIDPRYLSDPRDVAMLSEGFQLARRVGEDPAFAPWRGREVFPGPQVSTPQEFAAFARTAVMTYFHAVGTCRLGAVDDPDAVVDPQLRVRGIANLRIADASVMPTIPNANTHAASVAIGERAAVLVGLGG